MKNNFGLSGPCLASLAQSVHSNFILCNVVHRKSVIVLKIMWQHRDYVPPDTRRNNNVIMTLKRRHDVVFHNDVIIASCARWGNIVVSLYLKASYETGPRNTLPWWRHQMETFSALLSLCAGNSPVTGEFPARPVTRSFDVFFDLRLNKLLSKQSWGWWFETPSRSLWHHRNVVITYENASLGTPVGIGP